MNAPYPERRSLRLKGWDYGRNGGYFITICTRNRALTLGTVVGGDAHIAPQVRLTALGKLAETYLASVPGILKYVVMPNHVHFIVALGSGPMWASAPTGAGAGNGGPMWASAPTVTGTEPEGGPMWASAPTGAGAGNGGPMWASAPTVTVPTLVRTYKTLVTKAHGAAVWQRGYYDHIIRGEEDFLRIWTYLDNNPQKWELDRYYTQT